MQEEWKDYAFSPFVKGSAQLGYYYHFRFSKTLKKNSLKNSK
jgi:hypothetical protein